MSTIKTSIDHREISLSGHEVFRIARGDVVEFSDDEILYQIRCDSPQSAHVFEEMQFELRRLHRELAVAAPPHTTSAWMRTNDHTIPANIVIPTVGDSVYRLRALLRVLIETGFPPDRIIVADDSGSGYEADKQLIIERFGCIYKPNSEAPGIPGNLQSALSVCSQPFVVCVDDGSIPHKFWVRELAVLLKKISGLDVLGKRVAMIGSAHINDWQLALAGKLPRWTIAEWTNRPSELHDFMLRHFYDTFRDGNTLGFEDLLRVAESAVGLIDCHDEVRRVHDLNFGVAQIPEAEIGDIESVIWRQKYLYRNRWPESKQPLYVSWSPGAQGLVINREFLDLVGGFTDDCLSFEMLLACKAAECGWWSLYFDGPPFVHFPSLGFVELGIQKAAPRQHRDIYETCKARWGVGPNEAVRRSVTRSQEVDADFVLAGVIEDFKLKNGV